MPQKLLLSLALICVSVNACKDDFAPCLDWAAQTPSLCNVTANSDFMSKHCKLSCKVCFETSAYGCADNRGSCKGWAQRGECQINPSYMNVNCKKSCNLCGVSCNDGNTNCPSWASTGECDKNPNWMKQNCKLSCNTCASTVTRPTKSSTKRSSPTKSPTKRSSPTKSPTKRSSPTTSSAQRCTVMNPDARSSALTVVFVASNYNDGDEEFANQAKRFMDRAREIKEMNQNLIKYVYVRADKMKSRQMSCHHGCGNVARCMMCDNFNVVREEAARCVPNPTTILVIHNSNQGGGAATGNIAVTSSYRDADLVAIHEFGHSLFMLADEYDYGRRRNLGAAHNCGDTCEKWQDLIGNEGVECVTACDGGKSPGPSLMNNCYQDVYFGLVNSRVICCIYKKRTGVYPDYCDKFKNGMGIPLQNYCASRGLGGSRAAGFMKLPPGENVGMSNPCRIKFVRNNDGSWASSESTKLPEDLYAGSEINGDVDDCQLGECHPTTGEARLNFQVEHQGVITYTSFKPTRSIEFLDYDYVTNSTISGTSVQTVTELTIIADCAANVTYKGECKAIQECSLLTTDPDGFVQASCPLKVDKMGCQYCQCAQAQPPADMIDSSSTDTQAEETSGAAKLMAPLVLGAIAFTL